MTTLSSQLSISRVIYAVDLQWSPGRSQSKPVGQGRTLHQGLRIKSENDQKRGLARGRPVEISDEISVVIFSSRKERRFDAS